MFSLERRGRFAMGKKRGGLGAIYPPGKPSGRVSDLVSFCVNLTKTLRTAENQLRPVTKDRWPHPSLALSSG